MELRDKVFGLYKELQRKYRIPDGPPPQFFQLEIFTPSELQKHFPFSEDELSEVQVFIRYEDEDQSLLAFKKAAFKAMVRNGEPRSNIVTLYEFAHFVRQILLLIEFKKSCDPEM